jgi:type VI secretion system protein ImpJ
VGGAGRYFDIRKRALLEVGALRTRLLFASDVTQAYACIPLAHLIECRADKQVVLEEAFIPTRTSRPHSGLGWPRS